MICVLAGHTVQADYPDCAALTYSSTYFRETLAYARQHFPEDKIYILSAKHGLIDTSAVIQYDTRLNRSAMQLAITKARLIADARDAGLFISFEQIVCLCAGPYLDLLADVFGPDRLVTPLAGLSIPKALERLKVPLPYKEILT